MLLYGVFKAILTKWKKRPDFVTGTQTPHPPTGGERKRNRFFRYSPETREDLGKENPDAISIYFTDPDLDGKGSRRAHGCCKGNGNATSYKNPEIS